MRLPALLLLVFSAPAIAGEAPRLFRPYTRPAVPAGNSWARTPVDAFILEGLQKKGLQPNRPASRLGQLRRVTFDLTGLPPTLGQQQAFLEDRRPGAYERAVDRLLASPAFGERWAQPWLDLVRYAESDGFNQDALRPEAHRYRDWVIKGLNADLPYRDFVKLQLAGDELAPKDRDALIATGYLSLWPDEYNAAQLEQRRQEILDDVTDTTGFVFLGLSFACARCHDHKYDPISQRDYFRLQSFFVSILPKKVPLPVAGRAEWEKKARPVLDAMESLVKKQREAEAKRGLARFNPDIVKAVLTPAEKRTPVQEQIAQMALKQMRGYEAMAHTRLPAPQKKKYQELEKKLAALGPRPPERALLMVTDVGPMPPPTRRLLGGDWRKPGAVLQPAFPSALASDRPNIRPTSTTTGRRRALAEWLTRDDHPLTARVAVNRVWQQLTGQGIVATPSDFGAQGAAPTHPELLDWLAKELVAHDWQIKPIVRLIVTSAAYRQSSFIDPKAHARALKVDGENNLLWRMRRRRLEGEAIRDAILAVSGGLHRSMYGPSALPELPAGAGRMAWKASPKASNRDRRSVYVLARRNMRFPLFDAFDQPDLCQSCSRRLCTTTAPQALALLNGDITLRHAKAWAEKLAKHPTSTALEAAYRSAWGRGPDAEEMRLGLTFLASRRKKGLSEAEALARFCHALFNTNEFCYID